MAAVHGAGTAFACGKVVSVLGFDLVAADIAANSVFDHQMRFSSSADNATPTCTPWTNPDRSCSLQRVQTG